MPAPAPSPFHPVTSAWFADRLGTPTDIQGEAWNELARGGHVLVTAPTGTGKTLAAFLVALDRLLTGAWPGGGLRVLYVSPLKALNTDVRRNLLVPLAELKVRFEAAGVAPAVVEVSVRSGDTPEAERRRLRKRAPEILITTPESLGILLTQKSAPALFGGLRLVILDEIHAVAGSKRGTSLWTALERLVPWAGEFQRVGLSATVDPPELMARCLGGFGRDGAARPVRLLASRRSKAYDVQVLLPEYRPDPDTGKVFWESLALELRRRLPERGSTLIFTNSRRACEKLARLLNENQPELVAYSHHGSLSRELRQEVEGKLKGGELRALVATNSLELGIDIGDLDEVVLAQTPRTAASAIQKVGRAGHRIDAVSRAKLYPSHGLDVVAAAVISRCIREQAVEPLVIPEAPLDVLAQTVLSMLSCEALAADEVYARLRGAWPYRNLTPLAFDLVLDLLAGRYEGTRLKDLKPRVAADPVTGLLSSRPEVPFLLFSSGGTIPDRGYFQLRDQASGALIGELDEEFVWERQLGDRFAFGTQVWRIAGVSDTAVDVAAVTERSDLIPFWIAEDQDRSWFLAQRVGEFLEEAEKSLSSEPQALPRQLAGLGFSAEAIERAVDVLEGQRRATGSLPHRHLLVAELVDNPKAGSTQIILHTFWGARVNRPWSFALAQAWEDLHGAPLETWAGDDQVLILVPPEATLDELLSLVTPANLEPLLRRRLVTTGFFGARFREAAGRALLLPKAGFGKRQPLWLTRLKSKNLLAAVLPYDDFPIVLEAWRQCLRDEFELEALRQVLEELGSGLIERRLVRTSDPSPFTDGVLWQQVNEYMYAGDANEGASATVDAAAWDSVLAAERPRVGAALSAEWQARLQQTVWGYAPDTREDLLDLLELRVAVSAPEWSVLVAASGLAESDLEAAVVRRNPGSEAQVLAPVWEPLVAEPLPWLERWLEWYGPQPARRVQEFWGLEDGAWRSWLAQACERGAVVRGALLENATEDEVCLAAHWQSLLRQQRLRRRRSVETRPARLLPGFLARWQGLTEPEDGPEALEKRLGQLLGLPLPAALWEAAVFPSRVRNYGPHALDALLAESGLDWFGGGADTVLFAFAQDRGRLGLPAPDAAEVDIVRAWFGAEAERTFTQLADASGLTTTDLTARLWSLVWQGLVSGTRFEALRRGLATGYRYELNPTGTLGGSRGFQRWSAARSVSSWRWWPPLETGGRLETLEDAKARARLVLERYGVVFRELLQGEAPAFQWKALFPALKLMELSGEVAGGRFFEGPAGLQFASNEALRQLELPADTAAFVQHAQDPSSLCGRGVDTGHRYPRRTSSTWLLWHGDELAGSAQANGKRLELVLPPEHPVWAALVAQMAARLWASGSSAFWSVETINEVAAPDSPWAATLQAAGFRLHGNRLLLMKPSR